MTKSRPSYTYIHNEFQATEADIIEVSFDRQANVQLLDDANFDRYKAGQDYEYAGGYAAATPLRFSIPQAGRWHVVVDLGGGPGRVKAVSRLFEGAAT